MYHNNVMVPKEFDKFRVQSAKDPYKSQRDGEDEASIRRKSFQYVMYAGKVFHGTVGTYKQQLSVVSGVRNAQKGSVRREM